MEAFHHTVAQMEVRDLTVLFHQDLLLVQQPQLVARTAVYHHTAVQTEDKVQIALFLRSLQDPQLPVAAPTAEFLLIAARMADKDLTV